MSNTFHIKGLGLRYGEMSTSEFISACLPGTPTVSINHDDPKPKQILLGLNLRRFSGVGRMALDAAAQALVSAGAVIPLADSAATNPNAQKTGLYIGSALGAVESSFLFMDSILDAGAQLASPTHFSHSVNNAFCGLLSMSLNIQGPSCTVCQFELSFAGALQAALCAIKSGSIESALVGAVEQAYPQMELVQAHALTTEDFKMPEHSCAVFFLISAGKPESGVTIFMPDWRMDGTKPVQTSDSGLYSMENPHNIMLNRFYTTHPAVHALDVAMAMNILNSSQTSTETCSAIRSTCTNHRRAVSAGITIKRASR